MKAVVLYQPGNPENLIIEDRQVPEPEKDQVLVKVRAFGLNRSEIMTRKGYSPSVKFPRVLGIECVGEIEKDPTGKFQKGQKVMAFMGEMGRAYDGGYAEFTVLPGSIIYPIQSTLPWDILGAIPEMFQTVHGSLFPALNIQKGETLLIRGGTSSVGFLAIQVAQKQGLKVIVTTRNPNKRKMLLEAGASEVLIDEGKLQDQIRSIYPEGVDKVMELVGAKTLQDSVQCVKPGGTVCMTGMLSESWSIPDFAPMEFIPATVRLTIYDSGQIKSPVKDFQTFIDSLEAEEYQLKIGKVFKTDQIAEAHRLMEANMANGKIVIVTQH
ncbi:zinc-binding dehydrogenase [Marivirga sp. S37H4]|uniref:Zinc-binding dehydrogenase n=1 Tax=Marivirga aurantiaca TaxID=2802615 RepID=A0A934X176_9BACT|nr:zinc-binding alcohol dehydrogenase family protein [Marivirga aurantiaca]MBK6267078.1 zinc-binding dehydrogenase [Marivirga aurantiaca]